MVDGTHMHVAKEQQRTPDGLAATSGSVLAVCTHETRLMPFRNLRTGLTMREEFDLMASRLFAAPDSGVEPRLHWRLDVYDAGDSVVVRAEAPGFEPLDFDIHVRGYHLVVRAGQRAERGHGAHEHRQARQRSFYRSILLPGEVDREKIEAEYRHGVLTVTLPKTHTGECARKLKPHA